MHHSLAMFDLPSLIDVVIACLLNILRMNEQNMTDFCVFIHLKILKGPTVIICLQDILLI